MAAITGPLARLATLLTGLVSDAVIDPNTGSSLGTRTLSRIWTATPQQPQPEDFPGLVLEFSTEDRGRVGIEAAGSPGVARNYYPVSIYVFVGVPATADIGLLHNLAAAWVMPIAAKLGSDIRLSGTDSVTQMGTRDSKDILEYGINGIDWNQIKLYGLIGKLWITEKPPVTFG